MKRYAYQSMKALSLFVLYCGKSTYMTANICSPPTLPAVRLMLASMVHARSQ